jgi:hypothetical protein
MAKHPHLFVETTAEPLRFTSPSSGPRDGILLPNRARAQHADALIQKLEQLRPSATGRAAEQKAQGVTDGLGIALSFRSEENFPLKFESLDLRRSGIELLAVKTLADNTSQATVFVPDGKLDLFLKRIRAYRDENTTPRREGGPTRPKNQDLVESISDIQAAALEAFWTDEVPFPATNQAITWEVWLRNGGNLDHEARLRQYAQAFGLVVHAERLTFVDRIVVLVRGTRTNLSRSIDILGMMAELRLPKTTAAFFTGMNATAQQALVEGMVGRLTLPPDDSPRICLLDTGLNNGHPLIAPLAADTDLHTYKPDWQVDDRQGHGTPMAGLAAFGDLTDVIATADTVLCTHRMESVKILHEPDPTNPDLYGAVTRESAFRVEVGPERQRVFCMAISAPDGRDRGRPSSWSAAIDDLAAAPDDDAGRLFVLSAGNTDSTGWSDYANSNLTDAIHDPAQAWNALTVGGYTDKHVIDAAANPGWTPLAAPGDLAPCSCTSTTWGKWPVKPDIVMEAGNLGTNPAYAEPDYIDHGLQLLSTHHSFILGRTLTTFGDTSAAAALASRLAAQVWAKYPSLTPEAVRALIVHSAEWTPAMIGRFTGAGGEVDYRNLVRCFGFGVPNFQKLMSSLDNSLTLIAQHSIQPFFKEHGDVKTRDMQPHLLPWPTEVLAGLGNVDVRMRVTLSYFVEPSPGARGWASKYGYQSHGLRFAVRKPLETETQFRERVNGYERDEDYEPPGYADNGWLFGSRLRSLRSLGSLHSDVWNGPAAELAARGLLAVYPTMGWWNKRPHLEGWQKSSRYALVVTIETPSEEMDVYTPVATQIGVPIEIEI